MNNITRYSFLLISLVIISCGFSAFANTETDWQFSPENEGGIRLITSGHNFDEPVQHSAIHIQFKDKWKTNWKHPGDTGVPIKVIHDNSQNIKNFKLLWPSPMRFEFYGIETWGYKDEVVLPVQYEVINQSKPVYLNLDVNWAVCDEICLFEEDKLSLLIKNGDSNVENEKLIKKYLNKIPSKYLDQSKVKVTSYTVNENEVKFTFKSKSEFSDKLDLFISEASENIRFPTPKVEISDDKKEAIITTNYEKLTNTVDIYKTELDLVLANGDSSIEFKNSENKPIIATEKSLEIKQELNKETVKEIEAPSPEDLSVLLVLLFAFIGGLILNVMPCVLPVLSIKVMSIIKSRGATKTQIRSSFLATVAGILFSFLVLAILVLLLKSAGESVSWGMQFQQPAFLIFLSLVTTIFACNQLGYFEFSLPSFFSNKINKKIDGAGGDKSLLGNFLTGSFATLLATPCTAPFLSTAIAFALGAGTQYIIIIFFAMGLGLAFPYILITIKPNLVNIFPKPGAWMGKVKTILALLLIATSLWLVYVMVSSSGIYSAILLFTCLLMLVGFLKFYQKKKLDNKRSLLSVIYISTVAFVIPLYFANIHSTAKKMESSSDWIVFEDGLIDRLVSEGNVIFVDVTADWCLTCKFNKANVVSPLQAYLKANEVKLIRADYTKPSALISRYLEKNDAYAIPLNKVYGPNAKDGIRLPSILTEGSIKKAVQSAK